MELVLAPSALALMSAASPKQGIFRATGSSVRYPPGWISIKNRLINLHCFLDRITDWG